MQNLNDFSTVNNKDRENMGSENERLKSQNEDYQRKIEGLNQLNDELNYFVLNNTNGQLVVNNKMLLKNYSPITAKLFGIHEGHIGKPIDEIMHYLKYRNLKHDLAKVLKNRVLISNEIETTDGNWYQVKISPYAIQNDHLGGAFFTFSDITELKNALIKQELRIKYLELVNSDLENFVYSASHDLMLPINNIQALTELLTDALKKNSSNSKSYISMINGAVLRFKRMLGELSDLGKMQAEMLMEQPPVSIKNIIDDIKVNISDAIHASHTVIKTRLEVPEIVFSEKNLRSILLNLICNAIKYRDHSRDPQISISTYRVPGFIVLSVQDNGLGIKEEDKTKIFEIYQRLDTITTGTGIGLYLLNKIMHAAGGKVELESEVGEGSTFKIYLKD